VGVQSQKVRFYSGLFTHIKHGDAAKVNSFLSKIANKGPNALSLAVNSRDAAGLTPLMLCASIPCEDRKASQNKQAIMKTLIQTPGVDLNAIDGWGRTALHMSSQNNDEEVVNMLLDAGADKEVLDSDYFTPADYTTDQSIDELLRLDHSCNPPEQPQLPLRLTPSKIRSQSPPKRTRQNESPSWLWGRKQASKKYADEKHSGRPISQKEMQEYIDAVTAAAHEAFDKAELAIVNASRAASSPAVRDALGRVESQQAFDSIFRTFQQAEAAIDNAALKASQSRVMLPGIQYEEKLEAALAESTEAKAQADSAPEQLGEGLRSNASNALDKIDGSDEIAAKTIDLRSVRDDEELIGPESEASEIQEEMMGPIPPQHTFITHLPGPCIIHSKEGTSLALAEKWAWALEAVSRLSHPPSTLPEASFHHKYSVGSQAENTMAHADSTFDHAYKQMPESADAALHPHTGNGHQVYNPDNIPYDSKTWVQMDADHELQKCFTEETGWYDGDKYSGRYRKNYSTASNKQSTSPRSNHNSNPDWHIDYEIDVHGIKAIPTVVDLLEAADDIATRSAMRVELTEQGAGVQEACDIGDDELEHRVL